MEEDLHCPVCCDIFKDPVILICTHSFCKACLQKCWDLKGFRECPICRDKSTQNKPVQNRILKDLCDAFLKMRTPKASVGSEALCHLHGEKLHLFCQEDQQLVCLVCRDAEIHNNHKFSPLCDVASEYKNKVEISLHPLLQKVGVFEDFKKTCEQTIKLIMTQANHTERQIKEEFQKLHQFLWDEEAAKIAELRKEEKQKTEMRKKEIEKITREISSISEAIRDIEDAMRTDDITFLKRYRMTELRAHCTLQDPEMVSGSLINVAKHLFNLRLEVWKKMQCVIEHAPVILDPNTAHRDLIVSGDLMGVQYSEQSQQLPDNPERFDEYPSVLGSEGYTSGIHFWDVEVGDNTCWEVGVMADSAQVKGTDEDEYESNRWIMGYVDDEYLVHSGSVSLKGYITEKPRTLLKVKQKPKSVRVELNFNKGTISFSDPDNKTQLHTFTHRFWFWINEDKVFPYFKTKFSLRILPVKNSITVTVQQPS
ncbi:zinc-binding protein A33-like [Alosa pseudoharengus]|uniref:zinc-binding protein A33-like n=1 Tax=Alosa pseudoharengus TaxID=34774 RepID=UPI003F88F6FD